jgi:murein L,D-transpeptidase YafK
MNRWLVSVGWRDIRVAGLALALLLPGAAAASVAPGEDEVWVHVDTREATLLVYQGREVVKRIPSIAIGRGGASRERYYGDHRTPLGEFRVRKVKNPSRWRRFFHIDYPNEERAWHGMRNGEIDQATYASIVGALRRGDMPPQDTPLGGYLGIHGLGQGDVRVHEAFHWTQGCVAVTNEEIDALTRWIRVGTRVVID